MPGILRKKTKDGKWRGWYKSHLAGADGYRKTVKFTGTGSRRDTLAMAHQRQLDEDRIAAGLATAPDAAWNWRDFVETVQDYLAYGESQGGSGGRPWGATHARNQRARLAWWHEQIGFETLEDLMQSLRPVETALVRLRDRGRSGKTLHDYQQALKSFCGWCVDRGYLPRDPLARLRRFDPTPDTRRRALTLEDIAAIFAVAAPERRLLYEMALFSGLRLGELRHLTGAHLDIDRGGVRLNAEWTKNRRAGFQPLPGHLVSKLARATEFPSSPLLPVPSHAQITRHFEKDLEAAAIPKVTEDGVVVFHSWRGTYATLLDTLGASAKETQELMRHATPVMTMQRYVQARHDRQKALVQTMAEVVISARLVPEPPATDEGNDDNFSVINMLYEEEEDGACGHLARRVPLYRLEACAPRRRHASMSPIHAYASLRPVLNLNQGWSAPSRPHQRKVAPLAIPFIVAAVIGQHLQEALLLASPRNQGRQRRVIPQQAARHVAQRVVVRQARRCFVTGQERVAQGRVGVMLGEKQ